MFDLGVGQGEEVHARGGEVVGIFLERGGVDFVGLAVEPADGPVVPGGGDPTDAAGVFEGVVFDAGEVVAKACMFPDKMTLNMPSERLGNVALDERDALVDVAIGLYKREQVSLGRAAAIAGMSSPAFLGELARRQIPINCSADELREDLEVLKKTS